MYLYLILHKVLTNFVTFEHIQIFIDEVRDYFRRKSPDFGKILQPWVEKNSVILDLIDQ